MIANNLISYEYVSLLISLLLLFVYRGKRKASIEIYKIYYWMIVLVMGESIIGVIVHSLNYGKHIIGLPINYFFTIIYFCCIALICSQFTVYSLKMVGIDLYYHRIWRAVVGIPLAIFMLLTITSPFTKWFFYFDNYYVFQTSKLAGIYLAMILYFPILWFSISVIYRKDTEAIKLFYICAFGVIMLTINGVSILACGELNAGFAYALCLILANFGLQKPGEIYEQSNAIRFSYFFKDLNSDFSHEKDISIILLKYFELEFLKDSYGENMINQLMRSVNSYLSSLYTDTSIYKTQQDIYIFKCEGISKEEEKKMIDEIFNRFKKPWSNLDISIMLQMSACVIRCPEDIGTVDEIRNFIRDIKNFEGENGKLYHLNDVKKENSDSKIIEAVRKAVENNTFKVYYQPIYSEKDKKIVAAEALIRLFDDQLGFVSPEVFIPIAEENGFILKIGRFVIKEVCKFFADNELWKKGIEYIEVNLSGIQMMQYLLAEDFCEIMDNWGLSHDKINFEITETSAMIQNAAVKMNIDYFAKNNVELSLDDFGTGYSNLAYLYNVPFSIMKVDKGILWAADKNEKADKVLTSTLNMANKMGLRVVVEGIETEEHVKKLIERGCDFFQGYFFSKPVKGEDFIEYITNFQLPEICKIQMDK